MSDDEGRSSADAAGPRPLDPLATRVSSAALATAGPAADDPLATRAPSAGLAAASPLRDDPLATRVPSAGLAAAFPLRDDPLATRVSSAALAAAFPVRDDPLATRVSEQGAAPGASLAGVSPRERESLATLLSQGAGDPLTTRASTSQIAKIDGAGVPAALRDDPHHRIGRYLVVDRLGAGGMGVVYRAYDPDLDRRVALKLLRGQGTDDARARLLREAQAMAKLSHPNVVPVFDVGVVDDQIFIAMDFIDGEDLGAWIAGGPRPWREVVEVFRGAGSGLAAAHAVGLVHRDFKPDNVLLARDPASGKIRAQVADFGLARLDDDEVETIVDQGTPDLKASTSALRAHLTHVGAILGTPAYMSPEQHAGAPVDPRADQFSFCVAFYEALYGQRPYTGDTLEALAAAARSTRRSPPPAGARVPGWLHQVVLRGMSPDPDARFPGMDRLLAALAAGEQRGQRRWLGAGALLAVGGLVGAFALHQPAPPPCAGAPGRLAAVWGEAQRSEAAVAFAATELPYADDAWRSAAARTDAWAQAWADSATEACAATQIRHELSPAIMDLRVACLDRQLQHLDALARLFQRADKGVVRRAVDAAASLPELAPCADLVALQADVAPPPPAIVDRVAAVRAEIAAAEALILGGKDDDALALLEAQRATVEALAYPPLLAEFLLATSSAQGKGGADEEALKSARAGLWTAIAAGDDAVARSLLGQLIWVSGYKLARGDEARAWIEHADAMIRRDGDRPAARASLLSKIGQVEIAAGRFPEAEAALAESLELYEASGADELKLLNPLNALSMARLRAGRYAEALPPVERALTIATAARGPSHPDLSGLLNSLALIHERHARYDEAIDAIRRSLAIIEATSGPEHPNAGLMHQNLGGLLLLKGRREEAEVELRAGLRILEAGLGETHPANAGAHTFLGDALRERGALEEAAAEYQEALDIRRAALGEEHHDLALPLLGLGQVALAEGRMADAIRDLERAEAMLTSTTPDRGDLGIIRLNLARALAEGDPARARAVARLALADLEAAGVAVERHRLEAEAWLREHPGDGDEGATSAG